MIVALIQTVVLAISLGGFAVTFGEFRRAWRQKDGGPPDFSAARRRREAHIQAIKGRNWNGLHLGAVVMTVCALALLLCLSPVAVLDVFPRNAPLAWVCAFGALLWVRRAISWFVGRYL